MRRLRRRPSDENPADGPQETHATLLSQANVMIMGQIDRTILRPNEKSIPPARLRFPDRHRRQRRTIGSTTGDGGRDTADRPILWRCHN